MITQLESESEKAFAVQAETPAALVLLVYPYRRRFFRWHVDEAQESGHTLFERAFKSSQPSA